MTEFFLRKVRLFQVPVPLIGFYFISLTYFFAQFSGNNRFNTANLQPFIYLIGSGVCLLFCITLSDYIVADGWGICKMGYSTKRNMRICATYKNLQRKDKKELTPRSGFDIILLFGVIAPLQILGIRWGSGGRFFGGKICRNLLQFLEFVLYCLIECPSAGFSPKIF